MPGKKKNSSADNDINATVAFHHIQHPQPEIHMLLSK